MKKLLLMTLSLLITLNGQAQTQSEICEIEEVLGQRTLAIHVTHLGDDQVRLKLYDKTDADFDVLGIYLKNYSISQIEKDLNEKSKNDLKVLAVPSAIGIGLLFTKPNTTFRNVLIGGLIMGGVVLASQKIKSEKDLYPVRVGNYRILYFFRVQI